MKKNTLMMLALVGMTAGAALNADVASQAPAAEAAHALSADEIAFAAKLSDQNRKTFCDQLTAQQRNAVMNAVKNNADANEAVERMLAAKELKGEASAVAQGEKASK